MSLYRFFRFLIKPFISILWPTTVVNKENYDNVECGALVTCNHYSVLDSLLQGAKLAKKEIHILCKVEAFEHKFSAWFLDKMGAIPVKRGVADLAAYRAVLDILKADKKLSIYPEGTRNKEGTTEMGQLKTGTVRFAIQAQKPIIPLIYYRKHKFFRRNYLYVGEPLYLDAYYGDRSAENLEAATKVLEEKYIQLRNDVNAYAEAHLPSLKRAAKKQAKLDAKANK